MVINVADALSVYNKTGGINNDSNLSASVSSSNADPSFGSMVEEYLGDAVTSLHEGEKKAVASVTGNKSDLTTVVTAMDNAEVVLEEITAIRDKVISAYQTITSSAI